MRKQTKNKYFFITDNCKAVLNALNIKMNDVRLETDVESVAEHLKPLPQNIIEATYALNRLMNPTGFYTDALEILVSRFNNKLVTGYDVESGTEAMAVEECECAIDETDKLIMSISSNYNNEIVVTDYGQTKVVTVNYQLVINTFKLDYTGTKNAILIATTNLLTYNNDLVDEALVQMFIQSTK